MTVPLYPLKTQSSLAPPPRPGGPLATSKPNSAPGGQSMMVGRTRPPSMDTQTRMGKGGMGMMGGAMTGAKLGTMVGGPGYGTAAGAIIGAGLGLFGSGAFDDI